MFFLSIKKNLVTDTGSFATLAHTHRTPQVIILAPAEECKLGTLR
jgi:predicted RNA binding protein YcfA (HicA-like mRNA interferase family)